MVWVSPWRRTLFLLSHSLSFCHPTWLLSFFLEQSLRSFAPATLFRVDNSPPRLYPVLQLTGVSRWTFTLTSPNQESQVKVFFFFIRLYIFFLYWPAFHDLLGCFTCNVYNSHHQTCTLSTDKHLTDPNSCIASLPYIQTIVNGCRSFSCKLKLAPVEVINLTGMYLRLFRPEFKFNSPVLKGVN